jgi:glycerol uptake facilitator-like aquaporin
VTFAFLLRGEMELGRTAAYLCAQTAGALIGVAAAHAMFDLPLLQLSAKVRASPGQSLSELLAAFGLVATILLTARVKPAAVASSVGLYIAAAYWFTASTSFANPAVTLARAFSDTFVGIRLADVPMFVAAQMAGAACAVLIVARLRDPASSSETAASAVPAK